MTERSASSTSTKRDRDWIVTVYDDDHITFEAVITVLILATVCSREEASIEAWEIDRFGQCVVHSGREDECRNVALIVSKIGIGVEATPDYVYR